MAEGEIPLNGDGIVSPQKTISSKGGTESPIARHRNKQEKGDQEEICKMLAGRKKKPSARQSIVTRRRRLQCHIHSTDSAKVSTTGVHVVVSCCCRTPVTIQEADPKTGRDHRILRRVADTITTWDEITTLGLELNCNPYDVTRLRNENWSIKGAAYEILQSFYARNIKSDNTMVSVLRNVLGELRKGALVFNLGLEELNSDIT